MVVAAAMLFGASACVAAPVPATTTSAKAPGWRLVWHDEFSGSRLDRDRWAVENESTFGDGNHELACLMDRAENLRLADGRLFLTARAEAQPVRCGSSDVRFPRGREYTSAMISTRDRASWTYGRFEVRAKLPTAPGTSQGLWPAVWMRPDDGELGEIDIVEALGSGADAVEATRVHQAIHHDYQAGQPAQDSTWTVPAGNVSDGFHVFAIEWLEGSITWFVDGHVVFRRTTQTTPWLDAVFSRPFFLRLNLAVGGDWPGSPTPATHFPGDFAVDYVRVFEWG